MRKWVSAAAVLAIFAFADVGLAAEPPSSVYSDFATDGVLACNHSRSALQATLNDASLNQYGDPLTFVRLKLTIRRQLAHGCRRGQKRVPFGSQSERVNPPLGKAGNTQGGSKAKERQKSAEGTRGPRVATSDGEIESAGANSSRADFILFAIILLAMTVGAGGWVARRKLVDRR